MLHVSLSPRQTGKSDASRMMLAAGLRPVTPADYLALRRKAAGLTRFIVARRLFDISIRRIAGDRRPRRLFDSVAQALSLVEQLELPGARARYRPIIDILGGIFPLDPDVYHQLADEPADRHPDICRGCGCSRHDSCATEQTCCSLDRGICTHCTALSGKMAA